MSIPDHVRNNFQVLLDAAERGDLALLECRDADTLGPRYVICAVSRDAGDYLFTPFGHMVSDRNPYDAYLPPVTDASNVSQAGDQEAPDGSA